MNRLSKIIFILLLVTGCIPLLDWDTPSGHAILKPSAYPSDKSVGVHCRNWYHYHYYRITAHIVNHRNV